MNCTAIRMEAAQGVDPWDLTIIAVFTLSLLFHLFCAYPIFKMARERFALYILVSKLFAAILLLLGNLSQHAATYVPLTKLTIFFVNYIATPCAIFSLVSNRLHIIALAANRAHAMFFPFHYTQKMTKKFIFVQCMFMHLLSIPIAFYLYNFYPPVYYTWSYVVVPPLFYAAIVTKFAWIKAHNRSWNTEGAAASASDKDSARITWTCFAIQIMAVCQLAYISAANVKWFNDFMLCDPIGKMLFFPVQLFINLNYVADELFLLLLCKEMRKNCRQLIGKVWPFTTAQVAATAANDNALRITQTQNINSANRNANNVNGNANNVNVNVVGSNPRWAFQRS